MPIIDEEEENIGDVSPPETTPRHKLSHHIRCDSHTLSLIATSDYQKILNEDKFKAIKVIVKMHSDSNFINFHFIYVFFFFTGYA